MTDEPVIKLLEEIRDLQKEHIASYKEAVKNQQDAIVLQRGAIRRQKFAIFVLAAVAFAFLLFMFSSWHH